MILSETSIRKIMMYIMNRQITEVNRAVNIQTMSPDFDRRGEGDISSDLFDSSINSSGEYVFPVGKLNGKSYKSSISSKPQAVRTDVGTVTDDSGKKSKRGKRPHRGYDISCPEGTPIVSVADGKVITSRYSALSGNFIIVNHDNGSRGIYCHLKKREVVSGDSIKKGTIIGFSGKTGRVTGPHLHFGFRPSDQQGETSYNPSDYASIINASEVILNLKGEDKKKITEANRAVNIQTMSPDFDDRSSKDKDSDIEDDKDDNTGDNKVSHGRKLSPGAFKSKWGPIMKIAVKGTPLFASVKMAQMALETGWGKHTIGDAKNLFGIKAKGRPNKYWDGSKVYAGTEEVYDGKRGKYRLAFRKYDSYKDSIKDHSRLLLTSSRYKRVRESKTPEEQAKMLKACGYATGLKYAESLISIINRWGFKDYD